MEEWPMDRSMGLACSFFIVLRIGTYVVNTRKWGKCRRMQDLRLRLAKNMMYGVESTEIVSILFHLIV